MGQGLFQIAMFREKDPLMVPQAVVVEFGYLRQRVIATVMVIARIGAPGFQPSDLLIKYMFYSTPPAYT